ncbi:uncharacterized protein UHOD_12306 [Ustilago sp. UG-2017b]|nr:uncharacterized protein UHOD_12306 [Ustilago sp. UG-2017b]
MFLSSSSSDIVLRLSPDRQLSGPNFFIFPQVQANPRRVENGNGKLPHHVIINKAAQAKQGTQVQDAAPPARLERGSSSCSGGIH